MVCSLYTSSSRASRGRKFQKKKNYIAKKDFPYRMCARRPTSAMPKPFLCFERAFCCSTVVMWPVLMSWSCLRGDMKYCGSLWGDVGWATVVSCDVACHVMSFDVVVTSFDAMWLLVLCHVTWCTAMWFCDDVVIQRTALYYNVLLQYYKVLLQYDSALQCTTPEPAAPVLQCTTPVLLCTTQVLLQYYSVLQSTTPVLQRTTKYYSSTTPVQQSATPVLLQYYSSTTMYYSSTTLYYKVLLHFYSVLQSTIPVLLRTTTY